MPPITALTAGYFSNRVKTETISNIIRNEGVTTPRVATKAPIMPPWDEPIKVAILTAIGPGVDSATAMKLKISSSVSHPFAQQSSRIIDLIPYPPPKETAPIFRNTKNNMRYLIT